MTEGKSERMIFMKRRLLTIIGARPQIIKAAAISRCIKNESNSDGMPFSDLVEEYILHTGQHYDDNMSADFIRELGVPEPNENLHAGSGSHGEQTAKMLDGIERVLTDGHFDGVILYGDTNSTLAGAVAASKLHIPVFHVEAGLRSFNMSMPEELNRIVCDQLSSIMFAPTQTAVDNLRNEGLADSAAVFANGKYRKVVLSGDVMYDNSMYFARMSAEHSAIMKDLQLSDKQFILATIHRDNNTDNPKRLNAIFSALVKIAKEQRVVVPLHPRTRKMLPVNLSPALFEEIKSTPYLLIVPPCGFFDIIELEKHSSLVMTDSGGVQKEAFFFETPTVILRSETEWVEIVQTGAGIITDANEQRILEAHKQLQGKKVKFPPLFGDGHASNIILQDIIDYINK